MKIILIVDDNPNWHFRLGATFRGSYQVLTATNQATARTLFHANKGELVGIILDTCVPGGVPNVHDLLREFAKTYHGPIIATATVEENLEGMIESGATAACLKSYAPQRLVNILRGKAVGSRKRS